jgi:geranylgeranyl reductase family protein
MDSVERVDVLIVGAGPAGASAALNLARLDPTWARRIVLLDAAVHPREKLCGGAVTHLGETVLSNMGLSFTPPHLSIREVELRFRGEVARFRGDPVLRITRRDEFDHWLVRETRQAGVRVREGERVVALTEHDDWVEVRTDRATFHAQVLVGADGSKSAVRRLLRWHDPTHVARLLEVMTEPAADEGALFENGIAVFDFDARVAGLHGYSWDFPTRVCGRPVVSRGVFDCNLTGGKHASLPGLLAAAVGARGYDLASLELKGHPIRIFNAEGPLSKERVLLAGDAAGVDALFGEGISFALAYGEVVARVVADAFARRCFHFRGYRRALLGHPLLGQLPLRTALARRQRSFSHPVALSAALTLLRAGLKLSRWNDPKHVPSRARHRLLRA